ncbi:MAG TPA: class I SAM-dependent methyltransferase [Lacunisphaera sp.]|jgi:SAM-dependent methyltransferase
MDHTQRTIQTYDQIAERYHVIATPEHRAWLEDSMREFFARLPGPAVLVAGCGEGRDSRYLRDLGACVVSFDLSEGMLAVARSSDPDGAYLRVDLRDAQSIGLNFDGIWACACLYHLTKQEFHVCLQTFFQMLRPRGVLFLNLKFGTGERFIDVPRDGYPGGEAAKELVGSRFYAFYTRDELSAYFSDFTVEKERRDLLKEDDGAMEFWLRKE